MFFGEVSGRGSVRSGMCPSGMCPSGMCPSGMCPDTRIILNIMKNLLKNIPGGNFKGTLDVEAYHKLDDATLKELGMYNDNYLVCLS